MSDASQTQSSVLVIPPEIQEKFGSLLELIKGSESMNTEERQYWINLLPVMTPEQIKNLEEILTNERSQLAEIDQKYAAENAKSAPETAAMMEEKIKQKRAEREEREKQEATKEEATEEELLGKIQSM